VQHVDPDRLALLALGEAVDEDGGELSGHLASCATCQQELRNLRSTVELAQETIGYRDEPLRAPESVWSGIVGELALGGPARTRPDAPPPRVEPPSAGTDTAASSPALGDEAASGPTAWSGTDTAASGASGPAAGGDAALSGPTGWSGTDTAASGAGGPAAGVSGSADGTDSRQTPDGAEPGEWAARSGRHRHERRGGRRWARAGAALAAAAAVGVLGTLVAVRPWTDGTPQVRAASTAELDPVAGGPAAVHGEATVVQGEHGPELRVTTSGLPLQNGFYQVWVFDGRDRMQAVGVLGKDSAATLPLPDTLDLRTFNVVDISLEPYDGDQTHSKESVLRGTLTR
jgi:hypothetical protein